MRKWEGKIVDIICGWCPKVKEPETSVFSLVRALKINEVVRKNIHLAAIVLSATIVTSLLLVSLSLSYPIAPPLKQNVYTKTFTDSKDLVSLDVIIYYETELDGTWRVMHWSGKAYNVTVLVKPTFINTSVVSMLRILQCHAGVPYRWDAVVHYLGEYHPVWSTPLDYGIDLNPYWTNNTAWTAGSGMATYAKGDPSQFSFDYVPLWYHFVLRLIREDGTREIFIANDAFRIPFTSTVT